MGGMLGGGPKKPVESPVVKMPDPEDPAVLEAARKRRQQAMLGSGRDSTRLTGGDMVSDAAGTGGQTYSKTVLG